MKRLLRALIRFYQRAVSSHTAPSCRFTPTCSDYALQSIDRFGALRGGWLALWRILRCNPWGRWGEDPVPQTWTPFPRGGRPRPSKRDRHSDK